MSNLLGDFQGEIPNLVAAAKGQLISKADLKVFIKKKKKRKHFCISALAL